MEAWSLNIALNETELTCLDPPCLEQPETRDRSDPPLRPGGRNQGRADTT